MTSNVKACIDHKPQLAIIDDDPSIVDSLKQVFSPGTGSGAVRSYSIPAVALREIPATFQPTVAIIDIWMPRLDGIELTRQLTSRCPALKVLFYSGCSDPRMVLQAVSVGASGYLIKPATPAQLMEAVQAIPVGKRYFPQHVFDLLVTVIQGPALAWHGLPISPRQFQILKLYAQNITYQQIADVLNISTGSAGKQLKRIRNKLHVATRPDLVKVLSQLLHPSLVL